MKKLLPIILTVLIFASCARAPQTAPNPANSPELAEWQQQFDLGVRYLSEGKYEEAIIAFLAVIEIEPKRVEAYDKLADAYIGAGDLDAAIAALQQGFAATGDDALQARADELAGAEDAELLNGYYYSEIAELLRYRFYFENGIITPMGTFEVVVGNPYTGYPRDSNSEHVYETMLAPLMAQASGLIEGEGWSAWRNTSHYWAGLSCTDCGEWPEDGSTPDWFKYGDSHAWSGEWKDGEQTPLTTTTATMHGDPLIRDPNQERMLP